jgi:hypothetical protein
LGARPGREAEDEWRFEDGSNPSPERKQPDFAALHHKKNSDQGLQRCYMMKAINYNDQENLGVLVAFPPFFVVTEEGL